MFLGIKQNLPFLSQHWPTCKALVHSSFLMKTLGWVQSLSSWPVSLTTQKVKILHQEGTLVHFVEDNQEIFKGSVGTQQKKKKWTHKSEDNFLSATYGTIMHFDARFRYTFRPMNILQEKRKKCFPPSREIEGDTAFNTILKKITCFWIRKKWPLY